MTGGEEEMTIIVIQEDMDVEDGITIRVHQDSHRRYHVRHVIHRGGHRINFDKQYRIVQTVDTDIHPINSVWRWARRATTVVSSIIFGAGADKQGVEVIQDRDVHLFLEQGVVHSGTQV